MNEICICMYVCIYIFIYMYICMHLERRDASWLVGLDNPAYGVSEIYMQRKLLWSGLVSLWPFKCVFHSQVSNTWLCLSTAVLLRRGSSPTPSVSFFTLVSSIVEHEAVSLNSQVNWCNERQCETFYRPLAYVLTYLHAPPRRNLCFPEYSD